MIDRLLIPERLPRWAERWPILNELIASDYGKLLSQAYDRLDLSILYRSTTHGVGHIERAMLFAALIAMNEGYSPEMTEELLRCCSWHDIGRTDDKYDEQHGRKSAERAVTLGLDKEFIHPAESLAAIHAHAMPDRCMPEVIELYPIQSPEAFDLLFKGLKDADNLDRVRIYDLDTSFLRYESTVRMAPMADAIMEDMQTPVHILCYGDSNTYGYNPKNGLRYPGFMRWPERLQEYLGDEYEVINAGMNSRTTAFDRDVRPWVNGLRTIEVVLKSNLPVDILIFMLGTNDCSCELGLDAEDITSGMERLALRAEEFLLEEQGFAPRIIIIAPKAMDETVLSGPFCAEANAKTLAVSQQLPEHYEKMAAMHGWGFLSLEGVVKLSEYDGEHLGPFGGMRIALKLIDMI